MPELDEILAQVEKHGLESLRSEQYQWLVYQAFRARKMDGIAEAAKAVLDQVEKAALQIDTPVRQWAGGRVYEELQGALRIAGYGLRGRNHGRR